VETVGVKKKTLKLTIKEKNQMIRKLFFAVLLSGLICACTEAVTEDGWISLFDGTLNGWKASENKSTWSVQDGMLVTAGPRSHLFYVGPVQNADFTNFEFKAEIKTTKGSNSGIYFHTAYQETDWPAKGFEVQVNNTHSDRKKTGGLYAVEDVLDNSPAKDGEWFTEQIIVQGSNVVIKVNGKTTVDWTEPPGFLHSQFPGRKLSHGTFALQGHDPKSVVYYRSIMVKPLPPRMAGPLKVAVLTGGHDFERKPFFEMFDSFKDVRWTEIQLKDHSEIFEDIGNWDYDVIVMYNMTENISQKRQDNFKKLLDRGIGLVCLHHSMGAFQDWPEFRKISGGKYYTKPAVEDGKEIRGSTYMHDIDMEIRIADKSHPITRGIEDFKIHDEGYKYCGFEKDNHVLLTVDHPESDKTVGWVRQYGRSKVCGIQLGHDGQAYGNPNYRKLVLRAIQWTAGRLK
jgi:type 1 glutamine amidotransferase